MNDTQWPRFQVFLQEKPGSAHVDVGSVHAPDAEMALFNARDVFVRRPECISLWVVPAGQILSKTRQELEDWHPSSESVEAKIAAGPEVYHAFCKIKSAGTQTHTGSVKANSPAQAMQLALEQFKVEPPPFVWWVFPARVVLQSEAEDIESYFAPAAEKTFRLSTDFHTHSTMRHLKSGKSRHET
jgi:ring-1,2-phenylacetyl-CoA epoxidase subunit PaaB